MITDLGFLELLGERRRVDVLDLAGRLRRRTRRGLLGRRRAEAAEDHVPDRTVHRAAHDVREDRAELTDERAGDDQEVVAEHEAGRRGGPSRVAVEHRDDDRHVRAADRRDEVHAEHARDRGADVQPGLVAVPDVEITPSTTSRPAWRGSAGGAPAAGAACPTDRAAQLQEREDRAGERDRTDPDVDVDLDALRERRHRQRAELERVRRRARPRGRRSCAAAPPARASASCRRAPPSARRARPPTDDRDEQVRMELCRARGCSSAWRAIAIAMPMMPYRLPRRAVSWLDRPRSDRMNRTAATT